MRHFYIENQVLRHAKSLKVVLSLLLCMLFIIPVQAQRKKKQEKVNPVEVARKIMLTGDFPQAQEYIAKELTAQKKLRRPTCNVDSLHFLSDTMKIAEVNIRSTQHIVFVDSLTMPKSKVIDHLNLHPEMGRITTVTDLIKQLKLTVNAAGELAYVNALGDNAFLSTPHEGVLTLSRTIRTGNHWSTPEPLNIPDQEGVMQDYPFLLSDGVSLYYAAQAEEGFGGWDIYVTRYDSEDKDFLKPQNIGMPFNSAANDYMYYIDESSNTGYFLTDRHQHPDSVCLYTFIPNATHTPYPSDTDFIFLYRAAHIHSIAESQQGQEQRIAEWEATHSSQLTTHSSQFTPRPRFIINNRTVYTDIEAFKSPEAKTIAKELTQHFATLHSQERLLTILRKQFATSPSNTLRDNILQIELERAQLINLIKDKEGTMRRLEGEIVND